MCISLLTSHKSNLPGNKEAGPLGSRAEGAGPSAVLGAVSALLGVAAAGRAGDRAPSLQRGAQELLGSS